MPRVRLTLEYDGTDFVGWQRQPNGRSVQAVLEAALGRAPGSSGGRRWPPAAPMPACTRSGRWWPSTPPGCSRPRPTCAGSHRSCPGDVAVVAVEEVPDEFDPRRWATREAVPVPHLPASGPRAAAAADALGALHPAGRGSDARRRPRRWSGRTTSRASGPRTARRPTRDGRSRELALHDEGEVLRIEVEGTAFLKHMVRNIVGSLVEVGRGKRPPSWIGEVLAAKDRTLAGPTAPGARAHPGRGDLPGRAAARRVVSRVARQRAGARAPHVPDRHSVDCLRGAGDELAASFADPRARV